MKTFRYKDTEITLDQAYDMGLTTSDLIAEYDGWLHKRSGMLLGRHDHPDHDDLAQEGRIGMWKGFDKYDERAGALPSWLTTHANWRMTEVLSRNAWTGSPPISYRTIKKDISVLSLDEMIVDDPAVDELLEAVGLSENLDVVQVAYHRGVVAKALDTLTPGQRKYVFLKFWVGVGQPGRGVNSLGQLKDWFGYDPQGMWANPKHGARARLRLALAGVEY